MAIRIHDTDVIPPSTKTSGRGRSRVDDEWEDRQCRSCRDAVWPIKPWP